VVDAANVLAKNFMSYTGGCRQEFTLGQKERADQIFSFFLKYYYQPDFCNSLEDKVEIQASSVGLNRVALQITPTDNLQDFSKAVTNPEGEFSAKLTQTNFDVEVIAEVQKWGSGADFGYTYVEDWMYGLSTYDLVLISKHILGFIHLNGYAMIAADANNSKSLTTFDIIEFRKLILGIYNKLPEHDQPWQFIPEYVTLDKPDNALNNHFDGIGDALAGYDNPFGAIAKPFLPTIPSGAPYLDAGWEFRMRTGSDRNGFDAVKLGNVDGVYPDPIPEAPDECAGEVDMIVPATGIEEDEELELRLQGFNFSNIAAFQLGFFVSNDDFEYNGAGSTELSGFTEENSVGTTHLSENELRVVWMDDNLSPRTLQSGGEVFSLQLKAKRDILNLQDVIYLDDKVLENFFLNPDGDCNGNASQQIEVNVLDRSDAGKNASHLSTGLESHALRCMPNPVKSSVKVVLDTEEAFEGVILFHDPLGKLLKSVPYSFAEGRNIATIADIADLPTGLLNVSVRNDKDFFSTRILKM
jgi:hypothetical protein